MGLNTNQILFVDNSNQISLVNPRPNLHKIVNKGCYVWQFNDQQIRKDLLVDSCYLERFQEILLKFKDLGPVISRHYDDMPNMELHHRNLVFMTLRLANFLKEKQISIIVFPFASNHHLEGFILEFAAEIIGAKLIFLYPTVINLLVLPIIQTNGVESRSLFPINFSKILLQGDIADLIAQMVDKNSMQLCNLKFFPFLLVKKSFYNFILLQNVFHKENFNTKAKRKLSN